VADRLVEFEARGEVVISGEAPVLANERLCADRVAPYE
jgi:hypothetical protein